MILSSNNQCFFQIEESSGIDSIVLDTEHIGYKESTKILEFETLEEGWHFGEGASIKKEIIHKALELDKKTHECGYFVTDAFPGLDGEIAFTIYYKDDYFEFIIENNEMVTYFHEYKDDEICFESDVSFDKVLEKIEMLRKEICSLSEYSISNIGINKSNDSPALPLEISGIVSLPYPKNAFYKEDERFASISGAFAQKLSGNPSFIGDSRYKTYPTITK